MSTETRVPLGSAAWFAETAAVLVRLLDRHQAAVAPHSFSFQEVFTGVPPHVAGGETTTRWSVRVVEGLVVELGFGHSPLEECGLTVVVDWSAAVPLAAALSTDADYQERRAAMVTRGHATVQGDPRPKLAVQWVFDELHDLIAARTQRVQ